MRGGRTLVARCCHGLLRLAQPQSGLVHVCWVHLRRQQV